MCLAAAVPRAVGAATPAKCAYGALVRATQRKSAQIPVPKEIRVSPRALRLEAASARRPSATPSDSIRDLVRQALALPDLREDRIASLRQAITTGTYHVPAAKLADALFAHMLVSPR